MLWRELDGCSTTRAARVAPIEAQVLDEIERDQARQRLRDQGREDAAVERDEVQRRYRYGVIGVVRLKQLEAAEPDQSLVNVPEQDRVELVRCARIHGLKPEMDPAVVADVVRVAEGASDQVLHRPEFGQRIRAGYGAVGIRAVP